MRSLSIVLLVVIASAASAFQDQYASPLSPAHRPVPVVITSGPRVARRADVEDFLGFVQNPIVNVKEKLMEQITKLDDKVKEQLDKLKVANVDFDLGGGRRLKGHARNHCGCGEDGEDSHTCGKIYDGFDRTDDPLDTVDEIADVDACFGKCKRNDTCVAYSFDSSEKSCKLFDSAYAGEKGFQNSNYTSVSCELLERLEYTDANGFEHRQGPLVLGLSQMRLAVNVKEDTNLASFLKSGDSDEEDDEEGGNSRLLAYRQSEEADEDDAKEGEDDGEDAGEDTGSKSEGRILGTEISGVANINKATFSVAIENPKNGSMVFEILIDAGYTVGELVKLISGKDLPLPGSLASWKLPSFYMRLMDNGAYGEVQFSGASFAMVVMKNDKDSDFNVLVGFGFPASARLSEIDKVLAVIDEQTRDNLCYFSTGTMTYSVLQQLAGDKAQFVDVVPAEHNQVKTGLVVSTEIDLSDHHIKNLLGAEYFKLLAQIDADAGSAHFEGALEIEANLGGSDKIKFSVDKLLIDIKSTSFEFGIQLKLTTDIGGDLLEWTGAASIDTGGNLVLTATFDHISDSAGPSDGMWRDAFGVKGLGLGELAIEIGANLATAPLPVPELALAGKLQIGAFNGSAAVAVRPLKPLECLLVIQFNELNVLGIVNTFVPKEKEISDTSAVGKVLHDIGLSDFDLHVVPGKNAQIGGRHYEQGVSFYSDFHLIWFHGNVNFSMTEKSLHFDGHIDPVTIEKVIQLDDAHAHIDAELNSLDNLNVEVAGSLTIPAIKASASVLIVVSTDEMKYDFSTTWLGLFSLDAKITMRPKQKYIHIQAEMKNDLQDYVADKLDEYIRAGAKAAVKKIEEAKKGVEEKQAEVNNLKKDEQNVRDGMKKARDDAAAEITKAQDTINSQKAKIAELDQKMADAERQVAAKRQEADKKLKDARDSLKVINDQIAAKTAEIKRHNDKAQKDLQAARDKVNSIQRDIDNLKRQKAGMKWYDPRLWGIGTAIGVLEASKATANEVLKGLQTITGGILDVGNELQKAGLTAAKVVAEGSVSAAQAFQSTMMKQVEKILADEKIMQASKTVAESGVNLGLGALEAAKQTQKLVLEREETAVFPIVAARTTANAALEGYKQTLNAAKVATQGVTYAASLIVDGVLRKAINIQYFRMDLELSKGTSANSVDLEFEGTVIGKHLTGALKMNLNDPKAAIADFAKGLVSGLL